MRLCDCGGVDKVCAVERRGGVCREGEIRGTCDIAGTSFLYLFQLKIVSKQCQWRSLVSMSSACMQTGTSGLNWNIP